MLVKVKKLSQQKVAQKVWLLNANKAVVSILKFKDCEKILDDKLPEFDKNTMLFDFITWGRMNSFN